MRLADTLFRRGHLSDRALAEVYVDADRPAHLDRCDICAHRALELGRWLDEVRATAFADADAAFPPERLAAQQSQILRRLEQVDHPARVIAFPGQVRFGHVEGPGRGIRPAWVGIAAAAGLMLGLLGGHFSARLTTQRAEAPATQQTAPSLARPIETAAYEAPLVLVEQDESDRPTLPAIEALEQLTPTLGGQTGWERTQAELATSVSLRTGRPLR